MPNYQIWLCDNAYARSVLLANSGDVRTWTHLSYRQRLNGLSSLSIDLVPNSTKIDDIALMQRILVYRDAVLVFSGLLLEEDWSIEQSAPAGDTYRLSALDVTAYADWRLVVPASGQTHDTRTDHADDVAKDYVYYHAGAGAAAARQFSDVAVAADAHAGTSITEEARYDNLLTLLANLANKGGFDWRFVPGDTGCTFTTAARPWGTDRTQGNGVNTEMIFSLDRRNVRAVHYVKSLLAHRNYIYVGGQGEGVDRNIQERSTAGDIAAYKRRETFHDATRLTATASLQAEGDAKLVEWQAEEYLEVDPAATAWPTLYGLGDLVTVAANRYGRTFSMDAQVVALNVEVAAENEETVTPELEKYA